MGDLVLMEVRPPHETPRPLLVELTRPELRALRSLANNLSDYGALQKAVSGGTDFAFSTLENLVKELVSKS